MEGSILGPVANPLFNGKSGVRRGAQGALVLSWQYFPRRQGFRTKQRGSRFRGRFWRAKRSPESRPSCLRGGLGEGPVLDPFLEARRLLSGPFLGARFGARIDLKLHLLRYFFGSDSGALLGPPGREVMWLAGCLNEGFGGHGEDLQEGKPSNLATWL